MPNARADQRFPLKSCRRHHQSSLFVDYERWYHRWFQSRSGWGWGCPMWPGWMKLVLCCADSRDIALRGKMQRFPRTEGTYLKKWPDFIRTNLVPLVGQKWAGEIETGNDMVVVLKRQIDFWTFIQLSIFYNRKYNLDLFYHWKPKLINYVEKALSKWHDISNNLFWFPRELLRL